MLEGRPVVVTGAGGALGRAVCRELRLQGARVLGVGRRPGEDVWQVADLTRPEDVGGLRERVRSEAPDLSGLVLLVGGYSAVPLQKAEWEDMEAQIRLNLRPQFAALKALMPLMTERGTGRVVAIGAYAALSASPGQISYNASKAALGAMMATAAEEARGSDVSLVTLLPSTIDTPANRRAMPSKDPKAWVSPDRLAKMVAFLLTDAAGDLNGAAIPVRGRG